ncbi:MAG: hypothetical protein WB615_10140 [Candidatus Tumulicola sp.]
MSIQPLEGPLGPTSLSPLAGLGAGSNALSQELAPGNMTGDAISRLGPPWLTGAMSDPTQTAMFGPLPGLLQQLMQMLQYMMGGLYGSGGGNCPPYGNGSGNCPSYGNEQYFKNATGSSEGDPHLSFNGNKWNSMVSHPNLLDSDSIPGGFRISTQVTSPNERGVTRNQSATIALNNGQTTVSMNGQGQASINEYGQNIQISAGQTLQLGNGATVTCNQNGSLTVDACNGAGGRIDTTLTAKGRGVDVDVTAHDVDLGGALVRGQGPVAQPGPIPGGTLGPVSGGTFGPISGGSLGPVPSPVLGPIATPFAGNPIENPFSIANSPLFDPSQYQNPYDLAGL